MKIPALKTAIADALDCDVPVFVTGAPGIGKSQAVAQVARDRGAAFVDIRLSMFDPVDLRGLPMPDGNGGTIWARPAIWPTDATRETVLLFDEMDRAAPSVLNAALQIVLDRRIGEHALPPTVRIVAAGNGGTDKGTTKLTGALANRFSHLAAEYDPEATRDHFNAIGMPAELVAFLHLRPHLGHVDAMKADADARAARGDSSGRAMVAALGNSFPTPRQWEEAAKFMPLPHERRFPHFAGLLSHAVAGEFAAFLATAGSLPRIADILANPSGAPVPAEPSALYMVATALARAATRANFADVQAYFARMPVEFSVMATRDAVKRDPALQATAAFVAWAARNPGVTL